MSFYGGLAALASKALGAYGNALSATLARDEPGEYSSDTATTGDTGMTTARVDAFLDSSNLQSLGTKFGVDLVRTGDALALISADGLAITPQEGDTLTAGSDVWTVVRCRPTPMGPNPVLFELLVRK